MSLFENNPENFNREDDKSNQKRNDYLSNLRKKIIENNLHENVGAINEDLLEEIITLSLETEEFNEALDVLKYWKLISPFSFTPHMLEGVVYTAMKKYRKSLNCFKKAEQYSPNDSTILLQKALTYELMNLYENALKCYNVILEYHIDNSEALFNKGRLLFEKEKFEKAEVIFKHLIKDIDFGESSTHYLALCFENTDREEDGLKVFEKLIERDPYNSNNWYNKGIILDDLGRLYKALESYNMALLLNPDLYAALFNKGNILADLGKSSEAIQAFSLCLKDTPEDGLISYGLATVYEELGDFKTALIYYSKAIELDFNGKDEEEIIPDCKMGKAVCLLILKKYQLALECFLSIILLHPNYNNLGRVYFLVAFIYNKQRKFKLANDYNILTVIAKHVNSDLLTNMCFTHFSTASYIDLINIVDNWINNSDINNFHLALKEFSIINLESNKKLFSIKEVKHKIKTIVNNLNVSEIKESMEIIDILI
ncbi:MAG: tetratricopeptide repeat protein [Chlorobiota bacterium]|nr:tetratricopeptide repeat protein [Chlorobiota bacterium]QQS67795.1 MAG: tetratricopeptide repeat protein [Chlorobiota bacterium]